MPLYEYECEAEERHRFEVIQKFSDPPVESCPTCGSRVHKLISSPAFQFKGTGWYVTDYARKGSEQGSPGSAGSSASGSAGSSTGSSAPPASPASDSAKKSD